MTGTTVTTPDATTGSGQGMGSNLRRVRWAVRATLSLGVVVSVAANVLHAQPHPISQAIAAWPPLALLLTVELISRVPTYRRSLAAVRLAATATIAGIAAWVSYWHMSGVAARYGETGASAFLLPLSVDGLVIVASASLVEIAGRISAAAPRQPVPKIPKPPTTAPLAPPATGHPWAVTPASSVTPSVPAAPSPAAAVIAAAPVTPSHHQPAAPTTPLLPLATPAHAPPTRGVIQDSAESLPVATVADIADDALPGGDERDQAPTGLKNGSGNARSGGATAPSPRADLKNGDGHVADTAPPPAAALAKDDSETSPQERRDDGPMPSGTAAAVAYWYRRDPNLHPAEIGTRIGRSERTVRRYWPRNQPGNRHRQR